MKKMYPIILIVTSILLCSCSSDKAVFAPKLGVCTSIDNANLLKESGYDYTEEAVGRFLIPPESEEKFSEKFSRFQNSEFPILACNSFLPGSLKSTGPETKHDQIIAFADTAFQRANKTGIKYIVFGSSGSRNVPDGFDKTTARQQFIELLKRMGPIAQKHDVVVVIEPLNKKESNIINSVYEGAQIARAVDHPNIKLLADFYHMAVEDEGPQALIEAGPLIKHCHIAEEEGRTAPGVNGDDFTGYFKALKQIGYTGAISIEGRWKAEQLPQALAYLKKQIAIVNDTEP
jgi:sugar phosphate isomerase/epimerase